MNNQPSKHKRALKTNHRIGKMVIKIIEGVGSRGRDTTRGTSERPRRDGDQRGEDEREASRERAARRAERESGEPRERRAPQGARERERERERVAHVDTCAKKARERAREREAHAHAMTWRSECSLYRSTNRAMEREGSRVTSSHSGHYRLHNHWNSNYSINISF